jgi:hypothetical protein
MSSKTNSQRLDYQAQQLVRKKKIVTAKSSEALFELKKD